MDRSMIDAISEGALMDKTPIAMRHLILNMASNTQQFEIRGAINNKAVNEVGVLTELTSLVRQLTVSQHQQIPQVKVCGICTSMEHFTDMCPTLQETESHNAGLVETNTVDSRIKLGSLMVNNLEGRNSVGRVRVKSNMQSQDLNPRQTCQLRINITINNRDRDIQHHLLQSIGSRNLPSQPILNPKGGNNPTDIESEPEADFRAKTTPLPFPSWTILAKKPETNEELLTKFRQVEINILLLDAIKSQSGRHLSAFIQKEVIAGTKPTLPRKCKDPGIFSIPCTIGEITLHRLRKTMNIVVNTSSSFDFVINSNQFSANILASSSNIFAEPGQMENNDRTLKELATLDVVYQPWCIQYPQLELTQTYELKSGLIHLLRKFHGLAGEDPHKHLK
ncbi:hypothetical protein CR513_14569, partial [Mucuna pruriens]